MACSFACIMVLGSALSLKGSADGSVEYGYFPDAKFQLMRFVASPSLAVSLDTRRTVLQVGYTPAFSETVGISQEINRFTVVQRLGVRINRAMSKRTTLSATASGTSGRFDLAALRAQLMTSNAAAIQGQLNANSSYRNAVGALDIATQINKRWRTSVTGNASYTKTTAAGLANEQKQFGVSLGADYALSARLSPQILASGGYIHTQLAPLLSLTAQAGGNLKLSPRASWAFSGGYTKMEAWFGTTAPRQLKRSGFVLNTSWNYQLTHGENAASASLGFNWAPAYDPLTDSIRSRVGLQGALNWEPAFNWRVSANGVISASTNRKAPPDRPGLDGKIRAASDTRISFAIPVTYAFRPGWGLQFGVRANLPAPHFSRKFELLNPDYWAYVGVGAQLF